MTTYILTQDVPHSPNGHDVAVWPKGMEMTGPTGASLHRQGKARIKPGRKPAVTKPSAPAEAKDE